MGNNITNKDKYIDNLEWVIECYKNKTKKLEKENKELKDRLSLYGYIHQD